jgi:hypothetical protein
MQPDVDRLPGEVTAEDDRRLLIRQENFEEMTAALEVMVPDPTAYRCLLLMHGSEWWGTTGQVGEDEADLLGLTRTLAADLHAAAPPRGGDGERYQREGTVTVRLRQSTIVAQQVLFSLLVIAVVEDEKNLPYVRRMMQQNLRPMQIAHARVLEQNRENPPPFNFCGCGMTDEDIDNLFAD